MQNFRKMLSNCARDITGDRVAKRQNEQIDRELLRHASAKEDMVKLLLLGAGESGKSTFVKQMKIIHGDGYSIDELNSFISIIHGNLLTSMVQIIKAMDKLNITLHNASSQAYASKIINFPTPLEHGMMIPSEIGEKMKLLWQDDGFQECLKHAVEYQLSDSAPYYIERMDRILDSSYTPNEQDVLRSRVQTTGIVETSFNHDNITYQLFDVGGQCSERRKWLHCFDDVNAVLFVTALSGYDMTLIEDGTTNRMEESLNLFQAICVNKFFDRSSIILFLNKFDLFTEKINKTNHHLRLYFPHYNGPDHDVSAAKKFILSQFLACNPVKGKLIYPHLTIATDTNNVQVVFKVVLETVIHEKMTMAVYFKLISLPTYINKRYTFVVYLCIHCLMHMCVLVTWHVLLLWNVEPTVLTERKIL